MQTPGKLDADIVHGKVESGDFDLDGQPFLSEVLVNRWDELGAPFQQFLAENRLSSHLWVIAKKI